MHDDARHRTSGKIKQNEEDMDSRDLLSQILTERRAALIKMETLKRIGVDWRNVSALVPKIEVGAQWLTDEWRERGKGAGRGNDHTSSRMANPIFRGNYAGWLNVSKCTRFVSALPVRSRRSERHEIELVDLRQ